MSSHYQASELLDYARGVFSGDDAQELFEHCRACSICGPRLAMVFALRQHGQKRLAARRRLVAMAAAIIIGIPTGLAAYKYLNVQPADVPAAGSQPGVAAPLAEYASTELPAPGFLRIRFGDGLPAASNEEPFRLKYAVEALWAGEFDRSVPILRYLRSRNPGDAELAAYLGISLYLSGSSEAEVARLLEEGTKTSWYALGRYSTFYLANHFLRTGHDERALELLEDLAAGQDSPARAAQRVLDRILESATGNR